MTIYTYDTEFLEDGATINLISIGIVCEDGREYYAVNSDMDETRISKDDWLMQNVVRHLPVNNHPPEKFEGRWIWSLNMRDTRVKPKWVIANEVREFLLSNGEPELWAYYAAYDHVALAQLYGKMIHLPEGFPMWTHDLMQRLEQMPEDFEKPEQDGDEHNALADARWNMKLLNTMTARVYPCDDGRFVVADGGGWLPGSFPNRDAAVAAVRAANGLDVQEIKDRD